VSIEVFRSDLLKRVPHGFLGRRGGVSEGEMWGLNVGYGSGDDPDRIAENRRRAIAAVLPGSSLATVHQIHSPTVVYAKEAWPQDERPRADAMVTDRPGLLLGVLTADCAPVLFADEAAGVVAAAHSGWRGAFGGVNEATIEAMEGLGAERERIVAAIGPSVAQQSYEVDDAFCANFRQQDAVNERFFIAGPAGKPHFDLPGYILHRMSAAGIGRAEALALDTYSDPDRFYSYRRSTHRNEPSYGRQIGLIGLPMKS
jgi:purine-nucleoside/S-methyl-5'-thioadenosine phosphorylase / adenosine deaminase